MESSSCHVRPIRRARIASVGRLTTISAGGTLGKGCEKRNEGSKGSASSLLQTRNLTGDRLLISQ